MISTTDLREQLRYAYDPQFRGFHKLMARRVKTILMVSNPYEAFSLSRDYSLTQDIYGTSQLLHLQNVPQIVTALSAQEALAHLADDHFDLVLISPNLPDVDTFEFARRVKAERPQQPIVLIVFDGRWFDETYAGVEPAGIDWTFAWRGNANVLLSIIKLVEDSLNLETDLQLANVGTILVVEDEVAHYSVLLPHLYTMLMQRTFSLVPQGINEGERQIRTRVRPKVLLARTFATARALFERHRSSLVGVISDLRTFHEDRHDPQAGLRFLADVVRLEPGLPVLVQSSEPNVAEVAAGLRARSLDKHGSEMRAALEQFVLEDIGFGDFVFRTADGVEIQRVANMWEMENALRTVPDESIVHHASRNDLSHWFRARGEVTLATLLRPVQVGDFASVAALRDYVSSAVSIARQEKYRGAIADFRPPEFDPDYPFLVLGKGSLGGKGRGLAFVFRQLSQKLADGRVAGVRTRLPATLVIGADEYDRFLRGNELGTQTLAQLEDRAILERCAAGQLDQELHRGLEHYVERIRTPLAVRSSSLLEDSHYQPSAGLYATYMLPNNDADPARRLEQLCTAVKLVYASACLARARRYLEAVGLDLAEAKMAIVVQEVAGRSHGRYFYPAFSGVAQSHNFYPVFQMKPEDGVATVALGLGKQVVEGGEAVRFCPRYPQVLPQFYSPAEVMKVSQRQFFALDLGRGDFDLLAGTDATLARLPLSQAEEDGVLAPLGSVVSVDDDRLYDGVNRPGTRVVTFARILKHNEFPLSAVLNELLASCRQDLGFPVELEFAADLADSEGREAELYFLQMRPLVAMRERRDSALVEAVPESRVLCRSQRVLGNGRIEGLYDILYVHPDRFDRGLSAEVAAAVARANDRLARERRPYVLIGPGRWGSFDSWLGIPVVWHQISGARVIVECPPRDLATDPSQGTHFFHNLTSAGVGYFSLTRSSEKEFVRWDLLEGLPGSDLSPFLRWVQLEAPLAVRMDGQTQQGVILLPGAV